MDDNKKLMAKMEEYAERFDDMFPTMNFMNSTNKEFITMIDECLARNEKASVVFNCDYSDGRKY